MSAALEALLQHPGIWRGNELSGVALPSIPSGFAELDCELPGGGWPRGALTEILYDNEGIGEVSLLAPALMRLSREEAWIAFVNPPYLPYAPALAGSNIDLSKIVLIRTHSSDESMWAMEQALRSGSCTAVLGFMPYCSERGLRRMQAAAEAGKCLAVYFAQGHHALHASPAALRVKLIPQRQGTRGTLVQIIKRRGGGWAPTLNLGLHHALAVSQFPGTPAADIPARLVFA